MLSGLCVLTISINASALITISTNTLVGESNLSLENQDVVVDGAVLTINGVHTLASLQLINGGKIDHTVANPHGVDITAVSISVDSTSSIDVSGLAIGDNISMMTVSYDSGTEANSEAMGSIPGPADGGEGYNSSRDDVDYVALHPGIVSMDDGLTTSVLSAEHKFDNPVMKITIRRTQ